MSEASKIRETVKPYLLDRAGLDLGTGGDKIVPWATSVDIRSEADPDVTADVRDLPFEDDSYEFVFSSHTLEDLEDTGGALSEWIRVLKPGGLLLLYLPDKRWYPNIGHPLANKAHKHDWRGHDFLVKFLDHVSDHGELPEMELVRYEERPPPGGVYDYHRRGKIEYSFLLIARLA